MEIGMGALKWRPDEVLDADMTDIVLAYKGHIAELKAIHGVKDKSAKPIASVSEFDAAFG